MLVFFAIEAIVERNLRICGEVARALPVTTINAICIPKPSKFQKPLPHILTKSTGVLSVNPQAQMNVTKVSNTAKKISGSGRVFTDECRHKTRNATNHN